MKIFAICIVKDEVDVLEKAIKSALVWAEKIIIIDHNSTDGTWELIDKKLRHIEKIEVFGQIVDEFTDGLRSRGYNKFKHLAKKGDWWCRLDADEFYIDDPREFLAGVGDKYDVVQCSSFQYYFTEKDVEAYNSDPSQYLIGSSIDSLKYYSCNSSEARFVRHNDSPWSEAELWPKAKFPNLIWPKHIRLKHYQYRYPEQIQHRLDLRSAKSVGNQFRHEIRDDWSARINSKHRIKRPVSTIRTNQGWQDRIVNSDKLNFDDGNSEYRVQTELLNPIRSSLEQYLRNIVKYVLRKNL